MVVIVVADDNKNGNGYPQVVCGVCHVSMDVIGIGSASGRLRYHCSKCGVEQWGKNPAAMALGSLGGKARAAALTSEQRREQAIKGGRAGGKARAAALTSEQRREQAAKAANILWQKKKSGF